MNIKLKYFPILIAVVLGSFWISGAESSQTAPALERIELTTAEKAWLKAHPSIRLGFNPDMQPLLIQNAEKENFGVLPDLFTQLEAVSGLKIHLEVGPWDEIITQAGLGEIDGLLLCVPALARAKGLAPTKSYLPTLPVVFGRSDTPFTINRMDDLKGKRVAYMKAVKFVENIIAPIENKITAIEADSIMDAMTMVLEGKADVVLGMNYDTYLLTQSVLTGIEPVFIDTSHVSNTVTAVRSEWPELLSILNKALTAVGEADINKILSKWTQIETRVQKPSLTDSERAWLKDHPVIRVASDSAWAPMEYAVTDDIYKGIAIDYLRNIEKKLDIHFEIAQKQPWYKLIDMAKNREIDMFSCVAKTPERSKYLSFTSPYTTSPVVIFSRMDVPYIGDLLGLQGKKVAVVKGYAIHETLAKEHPGLTLVPASDIHDALHRLNSGDVYAYVGNLVVTSYTISEYGHNLIKVAGETPYDLSLGMASRSDWPVFTNILQKAMNSISEGERNQIYRKWTSVTYEHGFDYSLVWKITISACLIFAVLFFWNRRLKYQVEKKTAAVVLNEERLEALWKLSNMHNVTEEELSEYALEEAVRLTRSKGGYFHFYDEKTKDILLNIWTRGVTKECQASSPGHYPLEKAGIWADCIRKNGPVIHNDYANALDKKGIPQGHFPIHRHLSVPVIIDNHIMAIAGVANKEELYDKTDTRQLTLLMNGTWQIIQRKRDQENLRLVKHSIEHSADPFEWIQKDARFFYVNEASCSSLGYTHEELCAMTVSDIYPEFPIENWHEFMKKLQTEKTITFETSHRKKNGEIFPVEITSNYLEFEGQEHVFSYVKDISDRIQYENNLRRSEKKFRAIFEKAPIGIAIIDSNTGQLNNINQKYCEIVGYAEKELLALNVQKITHPDDLNKNLNNMKLLRAGKINEFKMEKRYCSKDGSIVDVLLAVVPLWDEGSQKKFHLAIIEDVTEQKKADKEKAKLKFQLQQAQKMETIGTLAGGIAHDFNNILSPIIGHTEILLEDTLEQGPLRDSLNEIYTSALRAKDLVKQILTFSRQEKNELKLIKIQPIIKEALKLIRSSIPTTISINQNLQDNCCVVKADPTQIHQIVMNLTTNAYHAMKETGGELNVGLKEMKLDDGNLMPNDMTPGDYACLKVADTGVGMENDLILKIFDPFFTTKAKSKGTGMGLSVVHGIVNSMGGTIQVYSELGKGSEFRVYLPIENISFEKQEPPMNRQLHGGVERVLIVDDEESIIAMERMVLERLGYQVTSHTGSIEALENFKNNPGKFDLVLTDMAMPKMPGDKLAVELIKIRPDIPILICTGFSETMTEKKIQSLGIKGLLLKPIIIKDLAQKIREVLDQ